MKHEAPPRPLWSSLSGIQRVCVVRIDAVTTSVTSRVWNGTHQRSHLLCVRMVAVATERICGHHGHQIGQACCERWRHHPCQRRHYCGASATTRRHSLWASATRRCRLLLRADGTLPQLYARRPPPVSRRARETHTHTLRRVEGVKVPSGRRRVAMVSKTEELKERYGAKIEAFR